MQSVKYTIFVFKSPWATAYHKIVSSVSSNPRSIEPLNPHVRINSSHFSCSSISDCFGLVLPEEQIHGVP